jgi:hypothetical protein
MTAKILQNGYYGMISQSFSVVMSPFSRPFPLFLEASFLVNAGRVKPLEQGIRSGKTPN